MNEQNTKKILFNKSSLLSLKAELLRKQEEVYEKKQLPQNKLENFKPLKSTDSIVKNQNKEAKSFKDNLKAVDTDELEALRKTKEALDKKTKLYEHLSDKAGSSQLADRFLVDFDSKKQQETVNREPSPDIEEHVDEEYVENDGEWIEFTDCLGRTRKCLKSDLDFYLKRDDDLMRVMNNDGGTQGTNEDTNKSEKPFLVQKTKDYLQSLREKWEEKEKELLAKEKDIHYQDLLFDEARIHGVGYYAFSTDETERRKQMEELIRRREQTLKAQRQTEELRKKRDELMASRVAAARARQRARAGLPPEEPQEKKKDFTECLLEFLTQQKNEADAKAKEEEKQNKDQQEEERQKIRDAYVREWDIGKEGVEDKVKKFKEMTQEEYVEQQRAKRIHEFAPIGSTSSNKSNNAFDVKGKQIVWNTNKNKTGKIISQINKNETNVDQTNVNKTWADVRPAPKTPPPPDVGDVTDEKGLYFTTVKKSQNNMKYKNFVKSQAPTPVANEVSDDEAEADREKPEKRRLETNYSEIAPPPTFDYYGPAAKQARSQKPFESDIREAYAQGAESLKPKSSNRKLPQHYDFTFD